ncbi:MAG TPA: hypothetical protein VKU41_26985 [Polyangiaceae bacterium]|nr:hypothetical protein [Polyangiaceae bacterium]
MLAAKPYCSTRPAGSVTLVILPIALYVALVSCVLHVGYTLVSGGATTAVRFTFCGQALCAMRDGNDNVLRRYFAEGQFTAPTGEQSVYLSDQIGSVRDVVDVSSGDVVASLDYTAYGQLATATGGTLPDMQFAGLFWDSGGPLYYSATRAYDSSVGRFFES